MSKRDEAVSDKSRTLRTALIDADNDLESFFSLSSSFIAKVFIINAYIYGLDVSDYVALTPVFVSRDGGIVYE